MKLRYTARARRHLTEIYEYLEPKNPLAAREVLARIRSATVRLREFPNIGHAGVVSGTHEWVVRGLPYIIVYQVSQHDREVTILGVYHGAQDR